MGDKDGGTPGVVGQRFSLNLLAPSLAREPASKHKEGPTDIAQQCRTLAVLAEDLGLILSTHLVPCNHLYLQFQEG